MDERVLALAKAARETSDPKARARHADHAARAALEWRGGKAAAIPASPAVAFLGALAGKRRPVAVGEAADKSGLEEAEFADAAGFLSGAGAVRAALLEGSEAYMTTQAVDPPGLSRAMDLEVGALALLPVPGCLVLVQTVRPVALIVWLRCALTGQEWPVGAGERLARWFPETPGQEGQPRKAKRRPVSLAPRDFREAAHKYHSFRAGDLQGGMTVVLPDAHGGYEVPLHGVAINARAQAVLDVARLPEPVKLPLDFRLPARQANYDERARLAKEEEMRQKLEDEPERWKRVDVPEENGSPGYWYLREERNQE